MDSIFRLGDSAADNQRYTVDLDGPKVLNPRLSAGPQPTEEPTDRATTALDVLRTGGVVTALQRWAGQVEGRVDLSPHIGVPSFGAP